MSPTDEEIKRMSNRLRNTDSVLLNKASDMLLALLAERQQARKGASVDIELLRQTIEDFDDCEETETPYATLIGWASMGILECTNFCVMPKAHDLINAAPTLAQEGGE